MARLSLQGVQSEIRTDHLWWQLRGFHLCSTGLRRPEEGEDWNVLWTHRTQDLTGLKLPQRPGRRLVNHCSYFQPAGNKCQLAHHVSHVTKAANGSCSKHLVSFALDESGSAAAWRQKVVEEPEKYWILKPCLAGASRGIEVHSGERALGAAQNMQLAVAQEYLQHPFLGFGGGKFHMRLYVFVPRWAPAFAVYLYNEGLIFRSQCAYRQDAKPDIARDVFSEVSKGKVEALPLAELWRALDVGQESRSSLVKGRIAEAFAELLNNEALRSSLGEFGEAEEDLGYACFDLFGADVILDHDLQPFIMEFNVGPNMWIDNHGQDYVETLGSIKRPLISQIVHWASLSVSEDVKLESMEEQTLLNFTRVL